jgi:hypothetical protein
VWSLWPSIHNHVIVKYPHHDRFGFELRADHGARAVLVTAGKDVIGRRTYTENHPISRAPWSVMEY